jgi:ABC-type branched-subunit amino acid transport system ATPase component
VSSLLRAEEIEVTFGGLRALDTVTLDVPSGEIVGLIGPNGAGKTTMFGVVSGLLRPRAGRIVLDGVDITRASPQRRARLGVARTFQRLELFGELTVREHLVVAQRMRTGRLPVLRDLFGIGSRADDAERSETMRIAAMLGIEDLLDEPAHALPLGSGRLVEVARALATEPRVVLLDEPSSGLDEHETERLADALSRLRAEHRLSLVLVEHDVDLVFSLADRVTVLDFGKVIAAGTPAEMRADPAVQAAYLGVG